MIGTMTDGEWADQQYAAIRPVREDVAAFDASPDGQRYLAITGMTMWTNLGGHTLPTQADIDDGYAEEPQMSE